MSNRVTSGARSRPKVASAGAPPATRAETKARTREALIDAGMALIARGGIEAPSLDAICERAGYTRGAFYVHFRDRDDFLVAVMDRVGRAFLERVLPGGDAADLSATTMRFVASVGDGSYPLGPAGGVRPHQLLAACARSPRIRRRYVELVGDAIARVQRVVAGGQEAGLVRADLLPADVALVLLCATIGAHTLLELRAPLDVGRAATTLLGALGTLPPASGRAEAKERPAATGRGSAAEPARRRARPARSSARHPAKR